MSSKTKIFVLHLKEIIYTIIIIVLILLLGGLFFFMFKARPEVDVYQPGVYSSSITLNNTEVMVDVAVSANKIESIQVRNMDDSVQAMYPLLQPSIDALAQQIYRSQSLENIALSEETPYTSRLLLNAIDDALSKAVKKS